VDSVLGSSSCSTEVVRGIALQLVQEIECMKPGTLAPIDGIPNVHLTSVVFPYLQTPAANALRAAATHGNIAIDSALRTLPQQYLLYHWYKGGQCGIRLAARVGNSNHEQGVAVDVTNGAASAMGAGHFTWYGEADPLHWEYKARVEDLAGLSVRAFQRLWNRNNPHDTIDEDGIYGSQTEGRLKKSPAGGFPLGAICEGPGAAQTSNATSPPDDGECDLPCVDPDGFWSYAEGDCRDGYCCTSACLTPDPNDPTGTTGDIVTVARSKAVVRLQGR
jgi:hypothetical protein